MTKPVQILCKNTQKSERFDYGTTLLQIYQHFSAEIPTRPVCAAVNNRVEGLTFRVFGRKEVEFLGLDTGAGRKVYMRSLSFVLYKAVEELCPGMALRIEAPVSKGYLFTLHPVGESRPQAPEADTVTRLRERMAAIIAEGHRFHRMEEATPEVARLFRERHQPLKAKLIEGTGKLFSYYYRLCDTIDYYYGPLVPSTDFLGDFDLAPYEEGILLRVPREDGKLPPVEPQPKMLDSFRRAHGIEDRLRLTTVGELNEQVRQGQAGDIIKVAEAVQEKRIAQIADKVAERRSVRVILVAGPSSSGKTTFSKRLTLQLIGNGLRPRLISLDDYIVDRERTPRDEHGELDYESIHALDLPLLHQHLEALIAGREVRLPHYNFNTGMSEKDGQPMRLDEGDVLIMEGIHGLNPLISQGIPAESIFKTYVSALTSIKLDDHNYVPTTDNRLIRRIVRDARYRGTAAADTIHRWDSVRQGEDKWIFPFQENADAMFNSALIYELAVLRNRALPLLESVREDCPEHRMAAALADFLRYFEPVSDRELPPTSLLREFLGGSSFHY